MENGPNMASKASNTENAHNGARHSVLASGFTSLQSQWPCCHWNTGTGKAPSGVHQRFAEVFSAEAHDAGSPEHHGLVVGDCSKGGFGPELFSVVSPRYGCRPPGLAVGIVVPRVRGVLLDVVLGVEADVVAGRQVAIEDGAPRQQEARRILEASAPQVAATKEIAQALALPEPVLVEAGEDCGSLPRDCASAKVALGSAFSADTMSIQSSAWRRWKRITWSWMYRAPINRLRIPDCDVENGVRRHGASHGHRAMRS